MTKDEQAEICKAIAVSCMWGQGGIASVIIDRLDRLSPFTEMSWRDAYAAGAKSVQRGSVGVITEKAELDRYLGRGYWLVNFDADGCSLFNPPPMNGLCKYVSKELADDHLKRQNTYREMFARAAKVNPQVAF